MISADSPTKKPDTTEPVTTETKPARELVRKVEQLIVDHPVTAVSTAMGIGVLAAWLIKRR